MKAEPTKAQIEELHALAEENDALGKPSRIGHDQWTAGMDYEAMCSAGWVKRYARPPRGFSSARFFGARITPLGRQVLAEAREKESRDA